MGSGTTVVVGIRFDGLLIFMESVGAGEGVTVGAGDAVGATVGTGEGVTVGAGDAVGATVGTGEGVTVDVGDGTGVETAARPGFDVDCVALLVAKGT